MKSGNLLYGIPADLSEEYFETLVSHQCVRIERIVSKGNRSPEKGWYDQPQPEWVVVLRGAARLEFADGKHFDLFAGDYINIPARTKHKVAWTDPDQETVWLAVHY